MPILPRSTRRLTRIVELTAIVKMLERTLYGTRSEQLRSDKPSDEQIAFDTQVPRCFPS